MPLLHWVRTNMFSRWPQIALTSQGLSSRPQPSQLGSEPGGSVSGDFFLNNTVVHVVCRIEQCRASNLRLRVIAELGTIALMGLKSGTAGQIELENRLVPLRVTQVHLPYVEVATLPHHARPVHRQQLRVPASFLVRVRRTEAAGLWVSGQGVDLSAGGCHFLLSSPVVPKRGDAYNIEMLITLPDGEEERPLLTAKVRWVRPTSRNVAVGMEVLPAQQRILATAVMQFQRALSRRPEEYLPVRP